MLEEGRERLDPVAFALRLGVRRARLFDGLPAVLQVLRRERWHQRWLIATRHLAAKHGLEKIKTIGDAFMAAAGLLNTVVDPLDAAVRCGLELASTSIDARLGWAVRVGVHVGPVVAGIVGQVRYQFDIWGDTVNVAARMAGKGKPGSVALTHDAWDQISSRFAGESLGALEVKGKGSIPVFEVRGVMA